MLEEAVNVITDAPLADLPEIGEILSDLTRLETQHVTDLLGGDDPSSLVVELLQETAILNQAFDCGFGNFHRHSSRLLSLGHGQGGLTR
jgi:hypothetical protein